MSWKEDYIVKHGEEAYEERLAQKRASHKVHKEEDNARDKKWREEHPEEVIAASQEACRKGGSRYKKTLKYQTMGLRGERNRIRVKHAKQYKPYKCIIAPNSQLHHQWRSQSASYSGLALVEKDRHRHGFIDVIKILKGEITVFTEEKLRDIGEDM